ncbi:hypothetical protein A2335_03035 [Candidatus Peregrinibacteria bacterium RIFOXYB2_FULL_32_7]|nr:MAG: hypothetical protein A2335_03035 [Candidatus Peregrinibacteria bacterium RIFOXYB2_FULL_32_7]
MPHPLKTFNEAGYIELTKDLLNRIKELNFTLPPAILEKVMEYRQKATALLQEKANSNEAGSLLNSTNELLSPSQLSAFVEALEAINPDLSNEFLLACKDLLPNLIQAIAEVGESLEGILLANNPMGHVDNQLLKREAVDQIVVIISLYFLNQYLQLLMLGNNDLEIIPIIIINLAFSFYTIGEMLKTRQEYQEICSIMPKVENKIRTLNAGTRVASVNSLSSNEILNLFYLVRDVERYATNAKEIKFDEGGHQLPRPLLDHLKAFAEQLKNLQPISLERKR